MISSLGGKNPSIHPSAFVHEAAVVIGDVQLGARSNVWPGAILRGDVDRITVGDCASIQDGAVLHTDPGFPTSIGEGAIVAHGCIIHGCAIGKGSLIAMGAIILTGAMVGDNCIVGAGTLVPEGGAVPSGFVALGIPARVIRSIREEDRVRIRETREAYQKLMKQYQK